MTPMATAGTAKPLASQDRQQPSGLAVTGPSTAFTIAWLPLQRSFYCTTIYPPHFKSWDILPIVSMDMASPPLLDTSLEIDATNSVIAKLRKTPKHPTPEEVSRSKSNATSERLWHSLCSPFSGLILPPLTLLVVRC